MCGSKVSKGKDNDCDLVEVKVESGVRTDNDMSLKTVGVKQLLVKVILRNCEKNTNLEIGKNE